VFTADAVAVLEFVVLSVAPAFRRDVCQVFAYPQKLAAHAVALDDPCEELCCDVDGGVAWLDFPPPHPAEIGATSAKTQTIWGIRALTVDTDGRSPPSIRPRATTVLTRKR
jgi:hypothetical protein